MSGVQISNSPLMEMQAISGSDPDSDVRVDLVSIQTSPSFASAKVQLFIFNFCFAKSSNFKNN